MPALQVGDTVVFTGATFTRIMGYKGRWEKWVGIVGTVTTVSVSDDNTHVKIAVISDPNGDWGSDEMSSDADDFVVIPPLAGPRTS